MSCRVWGLVFVRRPLRLVAVCLLLLLLPGVAGALQVHPDFLIVPGKRIGGAQIGARLHDIALLLGDRGIVKAGQGIWRDWYLGIRGALGLSWPTRGFVVVLCYANAPEVRQNQVIALILVDNDEAEDVRRFATSEGSRIGSGELEISRIYGAASGKWETPFGEQRWWYDRPGVFFDFDDDRIVRAIGVYSPELCAEGHE